VGNRPSQLEVVPHAQGQLTALERALDRSRRDLAVALQRVAVAGREERAVDRDRQEEFRPGDELLAVEVSAAEPRWPSRVDAGLVRRHAEHAEERRQPNLATGAVSAKSGVGVQLPREHGGFAVGNIEPVVQERRPAAGDSEAEWADPHGVDPDLEHVSGPGAANRNGPDQSVAGVELPVARLEVLALGSVGTWRLETPARVEGREGDRVTGVDLEQRLELAREVAVQVAPLERQLVQGH
jgi:hypothetical protein